MDSARGVAFTNATLSAVDRHCHPINTDQFNILWHGKYKLAGNKDSSSGATGTEYSSAAKSYRTIMKWIPLKRQLRFDNETITKPTDTSAFMVWWFGTFGQAPGGAVTPDIAQVGYSIRCSFRDTGTV